MRMYWPKSSSERSLNSLPLLLVTAVLVMACGNPRNRMREEPIARVHNYYLYPQDIKGLVPESSSPADSAVIVKSFIEQWARRRAILHQAEFNLTQEQLDVSRMLEDYRATLLIFEYEKDYLLQKMDTIVTDTDIENYYLEHLNSFRLSDPIIKGVYFSVTANLPSLSDIRNAIRSTRPAEYTRLSVIIGEDADFIESFEDKWVSFSSLNQRIPGYIENLEVFLRSNRFLESENQGIIHFVKILEYKLSGEVAPLEYVSEQVKDNILNRRKVNFIKELESSIYDRAILNNEIEIYNHVP